MALSSLAVTLVAMTVLEQCGVHEFGRSLSVQAIEGCVAEVPARFSGVRIRSFVPLLVHRAVRERLSAVLAGPAPRVGG
jgi:hypothetical protein